MIVYDSIEEARTACEEYVEKITRLMEEMGVWEECEDSSAFESAATYVCAKYYDSDNNVKTISYFA